MSQQIHITRRTCGQHDSVLHPPPASSGRTNPIDFVPPIRAGNHFPVESRRRRLRSGQNQPVVSTGVRTPPLRSACHCLLQETFATIPSRIFNKACCTLARYVASNRGFSIAHQQMLSILSSVNNVGLAALDGRPVRHYVISRRQMFTQTHPRPRQPTFGEGRGIH